MPSYIEHYRLAIERTSAEGYERVPFQIPSEPGRITPEHGDELKEVMSNLLNTEEDFDIKKLSRRCAQISVELKSPLERIVGIPSIFTIGEVKFKGTPIAPAEGLSL